MHFRPLEKGFVHYAVKSCVHLFISLSPSQSLTVGKKERRKYTANAREVEEEDKEEEEEEEEEEEARRQVLTSCILWHKTWERERERGGERVMVAVM